MVIDGSTEFHAVQILSLLQNYLHNSPNYSTTSGRFQHGTLGEMVAQGTQHLDRAAMVPRTEAVRRKRRHGVLVIWLFECVGSLKCLRILCDFMIFYVDWFPAIETIELGHFIDFVILRFLCQPSLSLCYIDGPKGSPIMGSLR